MILCETMICSSPGSFYPGFSKQDYWSGLPFPAPGDLLDAAIKPKFLAMGGGFFTAELPEKPVR